MRYRTDWITFGVAGALIIGFVVWGAVSTESLTSVSQAALSAVVTYGGWIFTLLAAVVLLFLLYVGFSRHGRIPLGKDGEAPAYSMGSWIAMLFAAGMGVGLIFFGVYEPVTYYMTPPPPGAPSPRASTPCTRPWPRPSSTGGCRRGPSTRWSAPRWATPPTAAAGRC
ncbi:BCCT family transporter [Kocuria tytonicola]|uniref:BCCT family transporter n=1 Tax=Kocuria tytonicola TaxID=2055946 RepID=UPI001FB49363|nr:BCCT family transporter [Kocuria tytonicola]